IERRITEAEHGADYTAMLWDLAEKKVDAEIVKSGENSKDTWLKLDLKDRDPEHAFTRITYDKGAAFLLLIEQPLDEKKWMTSYVNILANMSLNQWIPNDS